MVQAGMRQRAAVYMAEELPYVPVRAAVAEEGVVVQDNALSAHTDGHLLGHELEALYEALLDVLHVMVPENEVNLPVESVHDVIPIARMPHAEISKVKHDTILRNGLVPSADEFFIRFSGIRKGPAAETDDVLMAEMRVGCEPDVIRFELVNGIYACRVHNVCNITIICAIYLRERIFLYLFQRLPLRSGNNRIQTLFCPYRLFRRQVIVDFIGEGNL